MKIFGIEITKEEAKNIAERHFKSASPFVLEAYPSKLKKKAAVLFSIKDAFEDGRIYTEKQVNEILEAIYADYVTLRRDLYDAGILDRKPDGSQYWLKKE